jgi:hypothetical protein
VDSHPVLDATIHAAQPWAHHFVVVHHHVVDIATVDIKMEADERMRAFVQAWKYDHHGQLPQEAHDQRMEIDALHTDLIHFQEEKVLFATQVRSLLSQFTQVAWLAG